MDAEEVHREVVQVQGKLYRVSRDFQSGVITETEYIGTLVNCGNWLKALARLYRASGEEEVEVTQ